MSDKDINKDIHALCAMIAIEEDRGRFMELVTQLQALLDQEEPRRPDGESGNIQRRNEGSA